MLVELTRSYSEPREQYLGKAKRFKARPRKMLDARVKKLKVKIGKWLDSCKAQLVASLRADSEKLAKRVSVDITGRINAVIDQLDDWPSDLLEDVEDYLIRSVSSGGQAAIAQLGVNEVDRVLLERAREYAKGRVAEMVTQINETTREWLRDLINDALEQGQSVDQLARRIEENHAFSASRAEMIARTELAEADSRGAMAGYEASGVVYGTECITAGDEKVSDICQECADVGVVPLGQNYPTGKKGVPNHINCRCANSPVLYEQFLTRILKNAEAN